VCYELQEQVQNDPTFLSKIIREDETWVYGYNLETKQQSSQWKSPSSLCPKMAMQVHSNIKGTLIILFISTGLFAMNLSHSIKL
jgi:Holliday junction resolvasome RuvABC DNA-binding subunit